MEMLFSDYKVSDPLFSEFKIQILLPDIHKAPILSDNLRLHPVAPLHTMSQLSPASRYLMFKKTVVGLQ